MGVDIPRQTINYRSPEVVWLAEEPTAAIDMWSVGVAVVVMCGHSFTDVAEESSLLGKWR